jgi:glycerol-3-phosphate acyltransferase PlsY
MTYALLAMSYLLGAMPSSYWVGRVVHNIDLREHGSGNLGATNAYRVMGARWAAPVIFADVVKGFLPVWLFPTLIGGGIGWTLAFGAAAIFGHIFSLWVRFDGGKGIATSAGVFLAIAPWAVLGSFVVWCVLALPTGYVSLGSLGATVTLPLLVALTPHQGGVEVVWFTSALAVFVVWVHRSNVRRLIAGTENRFGAGEPEGPPPGSDAPETVESEA